LNESEAVDALGMRNYSWRHLRGNDVQESRFDPGNPGYIDFDTYEVRIDGREVKLTFTEFEILRCLVNNSRRIMSHSQLACLVWGEDGQGSRNVLKMHIQHLRNKLGDTAKPPHYILSERGLGYKFSAV
jgi:DNA-binding response OmpR family regulator